MRLHLDSDLGGDPDDVGALALALAHPDADLVAVTTVADPAGQRAGLVRHCLDLAGRGEVPAVAGAGRSLSHGELAHPVRDERYWPAEVASRPGAPGAALDRLAESVAGGAVVVAIGPLTNLALLEVARPGTLTGAQVVMMGGWLRAPGAGLPDWGPARDSNTVWDPLAARLVFDTAGHLTVVTLADTVQTHVRAADLPRLHAAGPLGPLLAQQAVAYAADRHHGALAATWPGLPDDLLHFLHDPLACAVALGWPGVSVDRGRYRVTGDGEGLCLIAGEGGREAAVVSRLDGTGFTDWWLSVLAGTGRLA